MPSLSYLQTVSVAANTRATAMMFGFGRLLTIFLQCWYKMCFPACLLIHQFTLKQLLNRCHIRPTCQIQEGCASLLMAACVVCRQRCRGNEHDVPRPETKRIDKCRCHWGIPQHFGLVWVPWIGTAEISEGVPKRPSYLTDTHCRKFGLPQRESLSGS